MDTNSHEWRRSKGVSRFNGPIPFGDSTAATKMAEFSFVFIRALRGSTELFRISEHERLNEFRNPG
jgi:hypothetical protein